MTLEVAHRKTMFTIKVATVETIIGRRLKLRYVDVPANEPNSCIWCHEESTLIHPVGWAFNVGHKIDASAVYLERCLKQHYLQTDANIELFNDPNAAAENLVGCEFKKGMMIEAVDPLNLRMICVAKVVEVLQDGYLMIRTLSEDAAEEDHEETIKTQDSATFCYHSTSACIAPPGFCEANGIPLKLPGHYEGDHFDWADYLIHQKAVAAPSVLFPSSTVSDTEIRVGMRVEAADLVDSHLICPATVAQVAGRLLRIHFDGWSDEYDQWMDSSSPELNPVGWCELVGYRLEAPGKAAATPSTMNKKKEKRGRPSSGASKRERSPSSFEGNRKTAAPLEAKRNKSEGEISQNLLTKTLLKPSPSTGSTSSSGEVDNCGATNGDPINQQIEPGVSAAVAVNDAVTGGAKKIPKLIDVATAQRKEALVGIEITDWSIIFIILSCFLKFYIVCTLECGRSNTSVFDCATNLEVDWIQNEGCNENLQPHFSAQTGLVYALFALFCSI